MSQLCGRALSQPACTPTQRRRKDRVTPSAVWHASHFSIQPSFHCPVQICFARQPLLLSFPGTRTVSGFHSSKSSFRSRAGVRSSRGSVVAAGLSAVEKNQRTAPFTRIGECLVYPPSLRTGKPKGLIHFLGGAFIGAAPDVTYSLLIELLAKEGFFIVATPYDVTFDHALSAQAIHQKFNDCLSLLSDTGFTLPGSSPCDVSSLPIFSVGHSNGALMQVLIGSLCSSGKLPQANAIISFNNKPAADAVPFFDQMGPTMVQVAPLIDASPVTDIARALTVEAIKALQESPVTLPPAVGDNLQSIRQFLDQIPTVLTQVTQGVSEFTPSPAQNREVASVSYSIPNNLLVKFTVDTIDETDILEDLIKPRVESLGGKLTKIVLNGTHATPLAPDVKWDVGREYSPVDAVAQVLKNAALADLRVLARSITEWFESV